MSVTWKSWHRPVSVRGDGQTRQYSTVLINATFCTFLLPSFIKKKTVRPTASKICVWYDTLFSVNNIVSSSNYAPEINFTCHSAFSIIVTCCSRKRKVLTDTALGHHQMKVRKVYNQKKRQSQQNCLRHGLSSI